MKLTKTQAQLLREAVTSGDGTVTVEGFLGDKYGVGLTGTRNAKAFDRLVAQGLIVRINKTQYPVLHHRRTEWRWKAVGQITDEGREVISGSSDGII